MVSGIGLDVIKESGNNPNLFAFKWYNPWTKVQTIKCYGMLWRKYFKNTKAMYVPFYYEGIYHLVVMEEWKI